MTSHEAEIFRRHNFGNARSSLKVEISWWLIENLKATWDIVHRVFQWGTIYLCPTIEEYSRIQGSVVTPTALSHLPWTKDSECECLKTYELKGKSSVQILECINAPWTSFVTCTPAKMPIGRTSLSSKLPVKNGHQTRVPALELAILGHVLFPKNLEGIDVQLLQFREQIEQGHISSSHSYPTPSGLYVLQKQLFRHTLNAAPHYYRYGFLNIWFHVSHL